MFYSENFIFDGKENDMMDIVLVTTEKTDILNEIGTVYIEDIKVENSTTDNPYYLLDSKSTDKLVLEFAYIDFKSKQPLVWDEDKLDEIIGWLCTDSFKPFISYDNDEITYYLKATKVYKKFNHEQKGMLEIEFQPYTAYGYKKYEKKVICENEIEVKVINSSTTANEFYEPILEILPKNDGEVEIKNLSIVDSKSLILKDLKKDEKIFIDNFTYTVQNDKKENKFLFCNRNWIKLKKGKNILNIKGNCEVTIKCNFPKII